MTETVLQEADRLINGARANTYGDAKTEFENVAEAWSIYLGHKVTSVDYTNMMIILKVLRARHGYHRDSYVDICGYAALGERVSAEEPDEDGFNRNPVGVRLEAATVLQEPVYLDGIYNGGVVHEDEESQLASLEDLIESVMNYRPRVWNSLADVPVSRRVADTQGDVWDYVNSWGWGTPGGISRHPVGSPVSADYDVYGPFTEVLEGQPS